MKKYLEEIARSAAAGSQAIPDQRRLLKEGYSFSGLSFDEQLLIWDYVWKHAKESRPKLHAFFYVEQFINKPGLLAANRKMLISWQDYANDWAYCDGLAKMYTRLLEELPEEMYGILKAWNKDTDLWKRRQSVVSLLYYARTKKKFLPFEKIATLIENLLDDKEYYVQKGVGWATRELYNVYPEKAFEFMKKHIRRVTPVAFTAAIEKLDPAMKEKLKSLRKK